MRLTFSVLWFDDREDYFDSLELKPLQQEVFSWGFFPSITTVTTPEEFTSYSPYKNFDLIVVDRDLEGYDDGQKFIALLRSHGVYTEVVFYTATAVSDLWKAVYENQLEGVYVSHRDNILSKISEVGQQAIRKVLDLENMRGIVMAEVGEIDHMLDEIITIGIQGLSNEQQGAIFKRFHKDLYKKNQEFAHQLEAFSKNPELRELLGMCDSSKRWENFIRLWKYHTKLKDQEEVGDYQLEVLTIRNILAHGKPETRDSGYLFRHHEKEFLFNDETSNELRKTILRYKVAFSKVLAILQE